MNNRILTVIVLLLAIAGGYVLLTMPDRRTTGDKIGDAVDTIDRGGSLGDAAKQLESRTPAEKIEDAVQNP